MIPFHSVCTESGDVFHFFEKTEIFRGHKILEFHTFYNSFSFFVQGGKFFKLESFKRFYNLLYEILA